MPGSMHARGACNVRKLDRGGRPASGTIGGFSRSDFRTRRGGDHGRCRVPWISHVHHHGLLGDEVALDGAAAAVDEELSTRLSVLRERVVPANCHGISLDILDHDVVGESLARVVGGSAALLLRRGGRDRPVTMSWLPVSDGAIGRTGGPALLRARAGKRLGAPSCHFTLRTANSLAASMKRRSGAELCARLG